MPAKDKFYDSVINALRKDGWTITDEEFYLPFATRTAYIDILAEKPVTAEKAGRKIAVEVKTFGGASQMAELEKAVGQFVIYKTALAVAELEHDLYLAVPTDMGAFFQLPAVTKMRRDFGIKVVTYDPQKEVLSQWID